MYTALKVIAKNENLSLLEYINENCTYMDKYEQEEILVYFFDIASRGDIYKKLNV